MILPMIAQATPPPNPDWNCDDPQFQQEMNWCAGQDYAAADAELNAQWTVTATTMKARDADFAERGDGAFDVREGYFESLLEAQRGWLRYRDAHCRVDGYTARGGSMEPLLALSCKARLTRLRVAELKDLAEAPG
ncbi:MAG: DUF1311 domain-containing protein [Sphingomonadales bacterium]|nr:DUF1311 domain-containing protein [Sphingomonadales bacterium]NCQ21663.1 DUF1311 domain-containing protein [Sphingomonadales bacterium]NCT04622.1 DUF1311 domain-containing protein [Sphingomonadales bacterium]